jgi:hypothetical protein
MGYILGTDEAGYGPNLGPLVISATVWEVPDGVGGEDLFGLLKGVVANSLPKRNGKDAGLPVFADSKILYKSKSHTVPRSHHSPHPRPLSQRERGDSFRPLYHLEKGLWAASSLLGWELGTWRDVWEKFAIGSLEDIDGSPFYREYDQKLPRDFSPLLLEEGQGGRAEWRKNFDKSGIKLLAIRSRAVFPPEFNRLMDMHESKGAALSHLTLGLAAELMQPLEKGPISVLCDKHGGRDRYAALLTEHFSDGFVEICQEGRQQSIYRFGPPERRVEFQFRAKAESCLPAALASMASKYLRELAMDAFNAFWTARVPNLAPTAGYPQDARRFRAEIAAKQRELGIDDAILWRKK